jgi:peptide subunit release factor RF-3
MGRDFAGVYNILENKLYVYKAGFGSTITDPATQVVHESHDPSCLQMK